MPPEKLPVLLMFAPELWGEVERFAQLHMGTFRFSSLEQRFLSGVANHFNKASTLEALAIKLVPNLAIDERELEENGHTPARNANELSAVIEAAILELYSCVDCMAKVVIAIYGKRDVRGLKDSTRGLFQNMDKITGNFPDTLKDALRAALAWYEELRFLRDELTHRKTGDCHRHPETKVLAYMHSGIMREGRAMIIEDFFAWFRQKQEAINLLSGYVFRELNALLSSKPVQVLCCSAEGRLFMRSVDPSKPLTFASGVCLSHVGFGKPGNVTCPFAANCAAYRAAITGQAA